MHKLLLLLCSPFVWCLCGQARAQTPSDTSPHTIRFVEVRPGVRLEVLDWGGRGTPLVFLGGTDAHVFDHFAPKFTDDHHVYGISRQGFGASSAPEPTSSNYRADYLADEILSAMRQLQIVRPVLVGHSLAGQELSSIGSRHPELVAGLIYLDAGYSYALYGSQVGDIVIDATDEQEQLNLFLSKGFQSLEQITKLEEGSSHLERDLQRVRRTVSLQPPRPANAPAPPRIGMALGGGRQKYTHIDAPVLAIYADPHSFGDLYKNDPDKLKALVDDDRVNTSAQADAFQAGVPSARVIRIPGADHFVFRSNEEEVMREVKDFVGSLRSTTSVR